MAVLVLYSAHEDLLEVDDGRVAFDVKFGSTVTMRSGV